MEETIVRKTGRALVLFLFLVFCLGGCGKDPAQEEDRGELVRAGEMLPGFFSFVQNHGFFLDRQGWCWYN